MARDRSSGEIVGTGALMYEFDSSGAVDKVEFAKFSVLPSARGLGAGTAIVVALLREAHRREALRVWVEDSWIGDAGRAVHAETRIGYAFGAVWAFGRMFAVEWSPKV